MTEGWKDRLKVELAELLMRIEKLDAFVLSPQIDALPLEEKTDLREQLYCMQAYRQVLQRRVIRNG